MPTIRADIVDVYILRRIPGVEFLQLLRAGEPLIGTWQPVMGHVEAGETAVACAWRELAEEVGLGKRGADDPALLGLWSLEQVHPFYLPESDEIVLSPRFAAEVAPGWTPTLNHDHTSFRWVRADEVASMFMWPGQASACAEILSWLLKPGSSRPGAVRIDRPSPHHRP